MANVGNKLEMEKDHTLIGKMDKAVSMDSVSKNDRSVLLLLKVLPLKLATSASIVRLVS